MGYRFVPVEVKCQRRGLASRLIEVEITWVNRGVGRALRDYDLHIALRRELSPKPESTSRQTLPTSQWIEGARYVYRFKCPTPAPGTYLLEINMTDPQASNSIQLPLTAHEKEGYVL